MFVLATAVTIHYIYLMDSLAIQLDIRRHQKIQLNSIMVQALELHRANEPMNVISKVHLQVASIHTIFVHSSKKIIDHDSNPVRVNRHLYHAILPIFDMPANECEFFTYWTVNVWKWMRTYTKCLFESSIVGNVLALRHFPIHIETDFVHFVSWILIDDTLGSISKCIYRRIVPPLLQITIFVVLTS